MMAANVAHSSPYSAREDTGNGMLAQHALAAHLLILAPTQIPETALFALAFPTRPPVPVSLLKDLTHQSMQISTPNHTCKGRKRARHGM